MFLLHTILSRYAKLPLLGFSIALLSLSPLSHAANQGARVGEADTVYQNGFVYTVDAQWRPAPRPSPSGTGSSLLSGRTTT